MSRKQAPYLTMWDTAVPTTSVTLSAMTWVGVTFQPQIDLRLYGFRYYVQANNPVDAVMCWQINANHPIQTASRFKYGGLAKTGNWAIQYVRPHTTLVAGLTYLACALAWVSYYRTPSASANLPVTRNHIQFISSWQTTAANPPQATITTNTNANGLDIIAQDPLVIGG